MTYNRAMKVSGYIRFALMIILLADVIHSAIPQDRIDSQILDPFIVDVKAKRPFCNAFTGCGRKRSSPGLSQNINLSSGSGGEGGKIVRLPLPLYRALLRAAASQEMNNQLIEQHQEPSMIQGGEYNNRIQDLSQLQEFDIQPQKIRARDQYES